MVKNDTISQNIFENIRFCKPKRADTAQVMQSGFAMGTECQDRKAYFSKLSTHEILFPFFFNGVSYGLSLSTRSSLEHDLLEAFSININFLFTYTIPQRTYVRKKTTPGNHIYDKRKKKIYVTCIRDRKERARGPHVLGQKVCTFSALSLYTHTHTLLSFTLHSAVFFLLSCNHLLKDHPHRSD